jgi:hypothetical protein
MLCQGMKPTRRDQVDNESASLKSVCNVFGKMYPSILCAFKIMQPQVNAVRDQSVPALASMIKAYQTFLGRLYKLALDEFARQEQEANRKRKRPGSGFQPEQTPKIQKTQHGLLSSDESKQVIRTLVLMVNSLDPSNDVHCELLEGYLCVLLDHVGSSLGLLVFADATVPQKKRNPGLLPPSGLLDTPQLDLESSTGTVAIQGPYLVLILRKTMDFLLANTQKMSARSLSYFTLRGVDRSDAQPREDLVGCIKATLQNTLLRGAFGDEDDTFYDSLRRDESEDKVELEKLVENIQPEQGTAEWFIGELWDHLGWDILSGQSVVCH